MSGRRRFGIVMVVAVATLMSAVMIGPAASAAQNCATPTNYPPGSGVYYMNATADLGESQSYTCLVQISVTLQAGESYLLLGEFDALRLNSSKNMLQALNVSCASGSAVVTTQNNIGIRLTTVAHYLFTAPTTGVYTCKLLGRGQVHAGTPSDPLDPANFKLRAYGGTTSKTYLSFSATQRTGNEWFEPSGVLVPLGSSAWFAHSSNWPITGQGSVSVYGGVEATNCYEGTYEGFPCNGGGADATVTTQLVALVTNSQGNECTNVPRQNFAVVSWKILHDSHHQKLHNGFYTVSIPSNRGSDCNFFKFKVLVKSVSGNPIVLEASDYTNLIAFNS